MNTLKKLTRELFSITYLSLGAIWWSFTLPMCTSGGIPSSIAFSIANIGGVLYFFLYADKFVSLIDLNGFDDLPDPDYWKAVLKTIYSVTAVIIFYLAWHFDYFGISNTQYLSYYCYYLSYFFLLHRAVKKYT